jgi:hypothetical protein
MITPSGDYLAGEVKHLVKGGEHCEGIRDRLINAAPGQAPKSAVERTQTSGAANNGPDYGHGEIKLHRESPLQAGHCRLTLTSGMCDPSVIH